MAALDMRTGIAEELSAIPQYSRPDLIELWAKAHGGSPPKGISRRLLEYSAAYQTQVRVYGGLKPSIRRKLVKMVGPGRKPTVTAMMAQKSVSLLPGARLMREWHGRNHTVEVFDDGFRYNGENYTSLSKVARTITGARWSGPRFFGL
jgi:hypothetical protein